MSIRGHDPVERLNSHHVAQLVAIARTFTEHGTALDARASAIDASGLDVAVVTPAGVMHVRVAYDDAIPNLAPGTSMRMAFRELARRAQLARRSPEDLEPG